MIGGWGEIALAFGGFLASHVLPVQPPVKRRLEAILGRRGYLWSYIALSLVMLACLIGAAGRAPFVPLLPQAPWMTWVPNLAMPLVCLLIAFGTAVPNPLSFGGARNPQFDAHDPGIVGLTRHPLLWALALWSAAHAVANPDLAHVFLFGGFAGFAVLGTRIVDRRNQRLIGLVEWQRLAARTSNLPFAALAAGRWHPRHRPGAARLAVAIGLWAALFLSHATAIGVSPVPAPF